MKKRSHLLLLLPVLAFFTACDLEKVDEPINGSVITFNTTVGGGGEDYPNDIRVTPDGEYVIVGMSQSFGNGQQAYIVKLKKDGQQAWENDFGGAGSDYAKAVTLATDGSFVLCGTSTSSSNSDLRVVRVNVQGGQVWDKSFGAVDSNEVAVGILTMPNGDFLVSYVRTGSLDELRLLRVNANGGKVSDKTVLSGDFFFERMIRTADGQIALAGSEYGTSTASYIVKITENGTVLWQNRFPSSGSNYTPGYGIVQLPDNNFVLAGSDLGPNTDDHDFNLVGFNEIGGKTWNDSWGGVNADELLGIARGAEGELVVLGYTGSFSANREIYLSKRKSNDGSKIWEQHFLTSYVNYAALTAADDGGFVLCVQDSGGDIRVVKTDKDGNYQ